MAKGESKGGGGAGPYGGGMTDTSTTATVRSIC